MNATRVDELVDRLHGALAANERVELLIDLAAELAQQGDIDRSRQVTANARNLIDAAKSSEGSIRLIVLEGIISYFESRSHESLDRLKRAGALSRAFGFRGIDAEIGVWAAHLAFSFGDCALLKTSLAIAFENIECLSDVLKGRLALVVADSYQYVGDWEASGRWYAKARDIARTTKSRALMTAVEFNRLAVGISRARMEKLLNLNNPGTSDRRWLMEIDTVETLHSLFRANALPSLADLCRSRLLSFRGEYLPASELLRSIGERGEASTCGLTDDTLMLEVQWLRVAGQCAPIDWQRPPWRSFSLRELDADDVVACLTMLEVVDCDAASSADFRAQLDHSKHGYETQLANISDALLPARAVHLAAIFHMAERG